MNTNDTVNGANNLDQHISDEASRAPSVVNMGTEASMDTVDRAEHRVISINKPHTPSSKFVNNRISTAKYSIIRFFPLFLFEQFRRWANIFFLMIALLQQIPDVSPTGRYTTLVPLIFILSVSAIKEIIEDIKRHRADDETNHRIVEVLREDLWANVRWKDVVVGDIVKVSNNNFFPGDLVLLSSSEPQGMSFIETANLDGETNLKIRQALPSTAKLTTIQELKHFSGSVECEPPNRHLYEFNGVLKEDLKQCEPLGPEQILLRGAMLRNTSWIFGLVVYTGHETKLMRNSTKAPLKRSTIDKLTNIQILWLFGLLVIMCLICSIFNFLWTNANGKLHSYIGLEESSKNFLFNLLTFLILFNNLIPISLQVTLEVVRFIQAIFINMDVEMYHEETDTPAIARTSNLNEELGQVKYIFSDKTGTLTRNVMEFKRCTVGIDVYHSGSNIMIQHLREDHKNADRIKDLLVVLSVCHTVIPEKMGDGQILYHAASPDERALVYGAAGFGYVFESRTPDYVEIDALGVKERYEILSVLEFTSARKRMSVIVKDPRGKIKLYCKGADTVIYQRLAVNERTNNELKDTLLQHLEAFATEGLRTLCCGRVELSQSDYEEWKTVYNTASCSLQNRQEMVEEAANLVEKNLILIGATAIEDKLQEGVPEAIAILLKADINLWVLTGDKQETAINIGYSCKLISQGMKIITLNEDSLDKAREAILLNCEELGDNLEKQNEIALIIDGTTLKYALSCELRTDFLKLCVSCKVVICCRVSPMQKAEVVEYVTKYTKSVTLAIGDGANDVAMIQKAHVGVGISGVEGLQAACASDYSIAQFRFLLRLLLVHGAWNYSRMCKLILYSFYKNICLYVIELWFAIYSGWSGQILFERWSIGLYNVIFTALPPLAMGLFDKSCSANKMLAFPQLYKPSQSGELFNIRVFWIWIANSLIHSAFLFWLPMLACQYDVIWVTGKVGDYLVLGNCVYTYVVVTVCLKAGLITGYWPWPTHCAIWGSIVLWFLFIIIYSFFWPTIPLGSVMTGMHSMLFTTAVFWLGVFLIPVIAIIPDFTMMIVQGTIFKSLTDFVRENEITHRDTGVYRGDSKSSLSETARLLKNVFTKRPSRVEKDVELSHGFAFSQEEGAIISQTDVIRAYDTNVPKPDGM
ncbi:probable phospholipid-transporting ATPase IA isoform X2 [Cylas formicarius]|uniref:probable phospholipid-transporting ATPase IA isoform X2 n=1 Tax=Cylas formicarius TaxID=197179 RepID=UPI0029585C66|nr:probable phospholipid-transporting ATPase IA isoform X2 [Cylas formicarius]